MPREQTQMVDGRFRPAVACEWDLINLQLGQIANLRCRVKSLEDAFRDVAGELDVMIGELRRDPRWDVPDEASSLKDSVMDMLHEAADTASNLLNPTTTIISDAEID